LANGLVSTLKSSVSDLGTLHAKLEHKSSIERENLQLFQNFRDDVLHRFEVVQDAAEALKEDSAVFAKSCDDEKNGLASDMEKV
jgi:hypothetical protein